ncbi:MAG: hypothetical protein IJW63_03365 [Lachnospiraceae bacterium]|nr:hypothetical protein [Lachnospiraceae bacterium]
MMEEILTKIIQENFEDDNGSLDFSCSKIEIFLRPGEDAEGSFQIFGDGGRLVEGQVLTSDGRMECLTPQFVGTGETISYYFHAEGMEVGDVLKGDFHIISNQGEYSLPYVVTVEAAQIESSMGYIKNLFHFANLAKTNLDEALTLFYSPEFKRVFVGNDKQYLPTYCGLATYPGNRQNMEEFLISINKKQKIEYLTEEDRLFIEDPEGVAMSEINIIKNGWGYVNLEIYVDGDFLYTEKETLSDDDFLGNYCKLPVYIDSGLLHDGKNLGTVVLKSAYDTITVPVVVWKHGAKLRSRQTLEKQRLTVQMMDYYQAFRMRQIGTNTWLRETGKLIEKMTAIDENDLSCRLFQAQLLITEERNHEAGWILDHVKDSLESLEEEHPVLWAYYLYLTTLLSRDETYVDKVTGQVQQIYKQNKNQWKIAWLLLYLSEEYSKSSTKKLMFLEAQFDRGCSSPVIYIEALSLIGQNPALLMKMGRFEEQVLAYAAKNDFLSGDIINQAVYLIGKSRDYSVHAYRFLKGCYAHKAEDHVLQEICALLIRGNKIGPKYFEWYKRGVEKGLRITRLYEYYMMSLDLTKEIELPKIVLMYFSYQSNLDYTRNAYLYANVIRNQQTYPELYINYKETIERFVIEQITKLHINKDLAYLYKQVLTPAMMNEQVADCLAKLMFVHLIKVPSPDVKSVVVYQPMARLEYSYPVVDGVAYVPLYGQEYTILFEDVNQNRFHSSISYSMEKIAVPGKLLKEIEPLVGDVLGFHIQMCLGGKELLEVTEENLKRFYGLLYSPEIRNSYKNEIAPKIIHYLYEKDLIQELDAFLDEDCLKERSEKVRMEVLKHLVLLGKMDKAYEMICTYGKEKVDAKTLLRTCNYMLQQTEDYDPQLLALAIYIFRQGKYSENILSYLVKYYEGTSKELRNVWKAAKEMELDTWQLEERILVQILFTGAFVGEKMEIFASYVAGGAREEVEAAFLTQCAYDYFVRERVTDLYVFEEILRQINLGEPIPVVSRFALLRFYAENKEYMDEQAQAVVRQLVLEFVGQGIYLKCFREFMSLDPMLNRMLDKTIIEYRVKPGSKAIIHYVLQRDETDNGEYLTEEMEEAYGGVCYKVFTLFFGESLQYYVVEETDGEEQLTESGTIQKSDIESTEGTGKYGVINDMLISRTLRDYETMDALMEEYYHKDFMAQELFKLI